MALLRAGQQRLVPAGQVLCHEGKQLERFFVLTRGTVDLSRTVVEKTLALGACGPGSILGLMAALDGQPCAVTLRAREDCTVVDVSRAAVFDMLRPDGPWSANLSHDLALLTIRRLRRATDDLAGTLFRALQSRQAGRLEVLDLARIQAKNHVWQCASLAA
jgi:CRP/FNR family cyclic AMP-dependent transcriptional regulator